MYSEKQNPKLSVLMSAYNAEKYIGEAIDSILNQTFTDWELIIADDGSEDKTKAVIDSFSDPRITFSHNQYNSGKTATINRLYCFSKGEYITIHDADDISHSQRFEKQLSYLQDNPEIKIAGCEFISFESDKIINKSKLPHDPVEIKELLSSEGNAIHGPTVIFESSIFEEKKYIYRDFLHGEDIDLLLRTTEKFKSGNISKYLYFYRYSNNSLTKSHSLFDKKRILNKDLIYFLSKERRNNGVDSLDRKDYAKIESIQNQWLKKYQIDKPYTLRFGAYYLYHQSMYKNSWILACKALVSRQMNYKNFNCFIELSLLISIKFIKNVLAKKERVTIYVNAIY